MVDAISTAAAVQSAVQSDNTSLAGDFDQFLVLLTTQLQHQDPLSPMDSADFTNQLVSFSGVEQQIKMNDKLDAVVAASQASLTNLGLSYIGLQVSTQSNIFKYVEGATMKMSYDMPEEGTKGTITVLNAEGNLVYSEDAELSIGIHSFSWDGTDINGDPSPAGVYSLYVTAQDQQQQSFSAETTVPGYVEGIETTDNGEVMLLVNEQLVPVSDISRARL